MDGGLLFLALLPAAVLLVFIYLKDRHKEPIGLLIKLFICGIISTIPAGYINSITHQLFPDTPVGEFMFFVLGVGITEETCKWLFIRFVGFESSEFDEFYDIIVYAVFVSLGFAALENIDYVSEYGFAVAIIRALTAVPGHATFTVYTGYFLAKAKLNKLNHNDALYKQNITLSLLVPALIHGLYDALPGGLWIPFYLFAAGNALALVNKMSKVQQNFSTKVTSHAISQSNNGQIMYHNTERPPVLNVPTREMAYCPICGNKANGTTYCGHCGFKLK